MKRHEPGSDDVGLSRHAWRRASQRGISQVEIEFALDYGTEVYAGDGCQLYRVDRRAMRKLRVLGVCADGLRPGLHVIYSPSESVVVTSYVNRTSRRRRRQRQSRGKRVRRDGQGGGSRG